MQPQRRVSLPAPARTTRVNGGPRLRMATPLPPFRASGPRSVAVDVRTVPRTGWRDGDAPTKTGRPYEPPAILEESPAFPLDAFIIPEGAARLPRGVGEATVRTVALEEDGADVPALAPPAESAFPAESSAMVPAAPSVTATVSAVAAPELIDTAPLSLRAGPARRPRSATLREQRANDVADRLEAIATQLRQHGYEVLAQKSVRGDALDALLAGVIAGYLVAAE